MIGRLFTRLAIASIERGIVPDSMVRAGIRNLCRKRLRDELERIGEDDPIESIRPALDLDVIAVAVDEANDQHYEVPAPFFEAALGPRLKYSSCYWGEGVDDLAAAEIAALEITVERAGLADAQDILELGCGWGSLTLFMAERFPNARITAVSNSHGQASFINRRLEEIGRDNVRIITTDMNAFVPEGAFDRIVSVEMFEHMRNWEQLLGRVSSWLRTGGRFFAHVFAHRSVPYLFEDQGADDWMSREFFTGGLMPSVDLMPKMARDLDHVNTWVWDGTHYEKTANAWLERLDARRTEVERALGTKSQTAARRQAERWRIFFMACAELFGLDAGKEWVVAHHLLEKSR